MGCKQSVLMKLDNYLMVEHTNHFKPAQEYMRLISFWYLASIWRLRNFMAAETRPVSGVQKSGIRVNVLGIS